MAGAAFDGDGDADADVFGAAFAGALAATFGDAFSGLAAGDGDLAAAVAGLALADAGVDFVGADFADAGAAEDAAALLLAVDFGLLDTVLAFPVLGDLAGAVAFGAADPEGLARRGAPDLAAVFGVDATDFFACVGPEDEVVFCDASDVDALSDAVPDTDLVAALSCVSDADLAAVPDPCFAGAGADDVSAPEAAPFATVSDDAFGGDAGVAEVDFSDFGADCTGSLAVAAVGPDGVFDVACAPDGLWAAASIAEDVVTTRLAGADFSEEAFTSAGLAAADLAVAFFAAGFVVLLVFTEVFGLESAIARTSFLPEHEPFLRINAALQHNPRWNYCVPSSILW